MQNITKKAILVAAVLVLALTGTGCGMLAWIGEVPSAASGAYPIVDTGQKTTYDNANAIAPPSEGGPFYGQDAQVYGNQPRYLDNGDGTVTDLVTGLMWQQGVTDKMTYSQAVAGSRSFRFAGYADWRLRRNA